MDKQPSANAPPGIMSIPSNSNYIFLPFVYFLPADLIAKCPTLRKLPRKIREVIYDDGWQTVVESDQFLSEIMDAGAALAFPHFGFGGWKEHYTGYCPVWKLSYAIPLWCRLLDTEIGWNLQALMNIPSTQSIPFFTPEYIAEITSRVVKRGIGEEGWQPILDIVREMPCDEDFEKQNTNVRKDFLRKWYHTRSKKVKTVSLEKCLEDDEGGIYYIPDKRQNIEATVIAKDFSERFFAALPERDREILQLRHDGFTYAEIADRLGYANHSGVIKRMKVIEKQFKQFQKEQ